MSLAISIVSIVGALTVSMVGFWQLSSNLTRTGGPLIRRILAKRTWNPFESVASGTGLATITGSSSSGLSLLLSKINAGFLVPEALPWMLMGIGLGTIASAWFLSIFAYLLGFSAIAMLFLALALPFKINSGPEKYQYGDLFIGMGLLFLGISLLGLDTSFIKDNDLLVHYLARLSSDNNGLLLAFLTGLVLSIVLRSNVGVLILAMSLSQRDWLSFEASASMIAASSLGIATLQCFSARSYNLDARRGVLFFLMVNLAQALLLLLVFPYFIELVRAIFPKMLFGAESSSVRLALFYTFLQLFYLLATLPLIGMFKMLAKALIKPRASKDQEAEDDDELPLLKASIPDALDTNLAITQSALARMASRAHEMLMAVMNASQLPDMNPELNTQVAAAWILLSKTDRQLDTALTESVQHSAGPSQALRMRQQQRIAHELLSIGADCKRIMIVLGRSFAKQYRFHDESRDELFDFSAQVLDFLKYNADYLSGEVAQSDWVLAQSMEAEIDKARDQLKRKARRFLENHQQAHIKGELAFMDVVAYLENIGDSCLGISAALSTLR